MTEVGEANARWTEGLELLKHEWERIPEMPLLQRCKVCGWGWKVFEDNDFPCPGVMVTDWPSRIS